MIRTHPDPILYRRCREATDADYEDGTVAMIAGELEQAMMRLEESTGLRASGLAAPQIGYDLRVFRLAQWPGAFVNPEIEYVVGKPVSGREGCFSLPGVWLDVERASRVKLRYLTVSGELRATKMRDLDARACQHEYDHLNGVTIIQRAQGGSEALIVSA